MPTLSLVAKIHFPRRFIIESYKGVRSMSQNDRMSILDIQAKYTLRSGFEMPALGFGVYQTPIAVAEDVVLEAFRSGYRHVDSARAYRNETPCAEAIRASRLKREEIFFTSKVPPGEMGYDNAKRAIDASLTQTGLDYIDLYLIHAPYGGKDGRCGAWRALVEAQKVGKIRSIGVSNYGVHHLDELQEYIETSGVGGRIDVGQWELHPWLPRDDIVRWARPRGIVIQAWSPLVRGQRAQENALTEISQKYGKTWAQVLLRWSLQKGYVPLPKSIRAEKIKENVEVFDFELSEEDMKSLEFPDSYAPCSWDPTVHRD